MKRGVGLPTPRQSWCGASSGMLQLRMWVGRGMRAGTQASQERHGSLLQQAGCTAAQSSLWCVFIALPWVPGDLWGVCSTSAGGGCFGFTGHQKKGRKENATAYGFDWMEMTAPKCELDSVVRTSNKNNNKRCVLLASLHLLQRIPNTPSLSRAIATNLSKIPKSAHPGTDVTPWSAGLPTQPYRISAWKQIKSSRAVESQPAGMVCLLSHSIP